MPGGEIAEPIIDIDDNACVTVAARTEEGHKGELYAVTGPRPLTFMDMAGCGLTAFRRRLRATVSIRNDSPPTAA